MLDSVPWTSHRIELAERPRSTQAAVATPEGEAASPAPSPWSVPVELRWGVTVPSMRELWHLHELSFPLSYGPSYYKWLLSDDCVSLVAYVTPDGLAQVQARHHEDTSPTTPTPTNTGGSDGSDGEGRSSDLGHATGSSQEVSVTAAAAAARARGELDRLDPIRASEDAAQRAETRRLLVELEYASVGAVGEDGAAPAPASPFTKVVGIVCTSLAYAQAAGDHLFTNPTAYVVNLAVLPQARGLGLGRTLVSEMLDYVTHALPLRASQFLHYSEAKMRAVAWRVVKASGADKAADGPAAQAVEPTPAAGGPREVHSMWSALGRFVFPEAASWLDRRRVRAQLIAGGMTSEEADEVLAHRLAREAGEADEHAAETFARDAFFAQLPPDRRRELLDPVVQRGVGAVWLHCVADDQPLRRFYERVLGFKVAVERVMDYYSFGGRSREATLLRYERAETGAGGVVPEDLATVVERRRLAREELPPQREATTSAAEGTGGGGEKGGSHPTLRRRMTGAEARAAAESAEGQAAMGEEGESDDGKGSDPSEASDSEEEGVAADPEGRPTPPISQWLSPSTYASVIDISFDSTKACRAHWLAARERRRALAHRARLRRGQASSSSAWCTVREVALTLNAVAGLGMVLYMLWTYGPR